MSNMYFEGWSALDKDTTLYDISHSENLPCCTFVAMWVLDIADKVRGTRMSEYAAHDRDWWSRANVYDRDKPWSALGAAQDKLSGDIEYVECVSDKVDAPSLTPHRWHIIQRWRHLELNKKGMYDDMVRQVGPRKPTGHTYLAYADYEGDGVTIVQSSVSRGYKISRGTWEGQAGLDGYSVAVLTLPE